MWADLKGCGGGVRSTSMPGIGRRRSSAKIGFDFMWRSGGRPNEERAISLWGSRWRSSDGEIDFDALFGRCSNDKKCIKFKHADQKENQKDGSISTRWFGGTHVNERSTSMR